MSKPKPRETAYGPVPDLIVERLALGALRSAKAKEVHARLAATGALDRLPEIEASNRAMRAAYPAAVVFAEVQRRLALPVADEAAPRRPVRPVWPGLAVVLAGAVAVAVVLLRPAAENLSDIVPRKPHETIALRGLRPHLLIYKKTTSGPALLDTSSRVRAGDTLQVAYVAAGRRYGIIASQDARGMVTFHLPLRGDRAAGLAADGETAVANAFELDNSPGFERFVFITADQPFSTKAVVQALQARDPSALPAHAGLTEIVLQKESP